MKKQIKRNKTTHRKRLHGNGTRLESSRKSTKMHEFVWEGGGKRGTEGTHMWHMDVQKMATSKSEIENTKDD